MIYFSRKVRNVLNKLVVLLDIQSLSENMFIFPINYILYSKQNINNQLIIYAIFIS